MAQGLIRRADVDSVRERSRLDEVVSEHVTLRTAGIGSMKGLCPFHDEKTPSFNVRPQLGHWHCFGCGEGGDVISFVQKINHLSFVEAVEMLAARYGVQLQYEDAGEGRGERPDFGTRRRLLDAHAIAEEYYREQLGTPAAEVGRRFLTERGFAQDAAAHFGVGFAPEGWDTLTGVLRGRGFTEAELTASGLVSQGQRGVYDRFRGRLVWPIRDITGNTIGFGARKLLESDKGPKYLNTPETAIYHKSSVLYGLDIARKEISSQHRVVVVEGYTDVMAAHLAGVTTAVASCGTAFGPEHVKIVRRVMGDSNPSAGLRLSTDGRGLAGEVIFTFDGDAAGQKAALRAFEEDQRFVAQTYVAVEASGMDPCDLRIQQGDQAVRELIETRRPLFEFAIRTAISQVDLDTVEGQVTALRMAAPVVARIRDRAMRPEYARRLSGWLGMDEGTVLGGGGYGPRRAGRAAPRPPP
ncbi:MAG: DNA primase, partial [Brachybacterium sp.]|nr:DNA primase [Brachybacterium sp.]